MTAQIKLTPQALSLLLLLALIWGGSFASTAISLTELGIYSVVAARVGGAALALWLYVALARPALPRDPRIWAVLLLLGVLGNALPFTLIAFGQKTVPTGLASILNASTAVFGVIVAALAFKDEHLTRTRVIGVALGLAGVITAIGWRNLGAFDPTSVGQMALIAASICYALTTALARVAVRAVAPQVAATGMMTGAALAMVPLALILEGLPATHHAPQVWASLAYSAFIASAVAYLIFYRLIGMAGAGNTAFVTLIAAPIAIVIGALMFNEALPPRAFAGLLLLAAGLVVLDGRLPARLLASRAKPG